MTDASLADMTFGALLVFIRVGGAVMLLPGFADAAVPPTIRIGLALAVTIIIAPLVAGTLPHIPAAPIILATILAKEAVIGLTLGWLTRTIVVALPVAGQIISYQIGLASVLLPSTEMGASSTLISTGLSIGVPALMLSTGLFAAPLLGLFNSFHWLPPGLAIGAVHDLDYGGIVRGIVACVADEFVLAMQLAAPFLVVGLIWQVGIGFMAKAAPQLQVFFVAAPLQILGGLILLGAALIPMIAVWSHVTSRLLTHGFGP